MSWRWNLSVLFVLIAGFSTLIFMGHETSSQAPFKMIGSSRDAPVSAAGNGVRKEHNLKAGV